MDPKDAKTPVVVNLICALPQADLREQYIKDDKGVALRFALPVWGHDFNHCTEQIAVMLLKRGEKNSMEAENDLISNQTLDLTSVFPVG